MEEIKLLETSEIKLQEQNTFEGLYGALNSFQKENRKLSMKDILALTQNSIVSYLFIEGDTVTAILEDEEANTEDLYVDEDNVSNNIVENNVNDNTVENDEIEEDPSVITMELKGSISSETKQIIKSDYKKKEETN